jgi:hypothetical protein
VSYYCEEGNRTAGAVFPTGEALRDVSVSVSSAGVLSFRFTRALAAAPGRAPPRPLGAERALAAFPLAQLSPATPPALTAALFPSWSVVDASVDTPAPRDAHFLYAGGPLRRALPYVTVSWATGAPTEDSGAKLEAMLLSVDAGCGSPATPVGTTNTPSIVTPSPSPPPSAGAASGADGSGSGGASTEDAIMPTDMEMGGSESMSMGGGMHDAFFVSATGWGSLLFAQARMETRVALVAAVLLSALFAALTTLLAAAAHPAELRGTQAGAHPGWTAAGFVSTALRTGSHYVSMLLVMTFNVWIILAVLAGHAAGFLVLATAYRNGVLPAAMLARGGVGGGEGARGPGGGAERGSGLAAGCGATLGGSCDCA